MIRFVFKFTKHIFWTHWTVVDIISLLLFADLKVLDHKIPKWPNHPILVKPKRSQVILHAVLPQGRLASTLENIIIAPLNYCGQMKHFRRHSHLIFRFLRIVHLCCWILWISNCLVNWYSIKNYTVYHTSVCATNITCQSGKVNFKNLTSIETFIIKK